MGEKNLQEVRGVFKSDTALTERVAKVLSDYREKARKSRNYKGGIGESDAKKKLRGAVTAALGAKRKEVE